MATLATRTDIPPPDYTEGAALQHRPWSSKRLLSRGLARIERFLDSSANDMAPWLAVAFGAGIVSWFGLPAPSHWVAFICSGLAMAAAFAGLGRFFQDFPRIHLALIVLPLVVAAGCLAVWARSEAVGAAPIERPMVAELRARILERSEEPANERVRLVLATRDPLTARAIRIRVNVPMGAGVQPIPIEAQAGALIRVRARIMPPAPPMLPGAYNFARAAWFSGLSATGTAIGVIAVEAPARGGGWLESAKAKLSRHITGQLRGSAGGIASALATGDRGAIEEKDAQAMRDSGLAHLLSISGLHVSAVIAAAYVLVLRLLSLVPWLALRLPLPVVSAGAGAASGLAYTLLTGAEVPTVRSCVGALLVLGAVALGREALSLRTLALAAMFILVVWPESLVGPSFQMSFAAVLALVALGSAAPVRLWLAPRDEGWGPRLLRYVGMVLLTGFVIEIALMPIGFFHFHRAGAYGALANVVAIPLTTFLVMPLVAGALLLDIAGMGAPLWWLAGASINLLLGVAHTIAASPGAVTILPPMGMRAFLMFVAGGLWLALFTGRFRLLGLVPAAAGAFALMSLTSPDVLVTGDGQHVGIVGDGGRTLLMLRDSKSNFVNDNILENAGMEGRPMLLTQWPAARCNRDFCEVPLKRQGQLFRLLIARGREVVPERALAAACDRVDIVIANRWLPRSCKPRWLKVDRRMLSRSGGITIRLADKTMSSVAASEGHHGWWRGGH